MYFFKVISIAFLLSNSVFSMVVDGCKSVAIDVRPLRYHELITTALHEENQLISESQTFDELRTKIKALPCHEVREKISEWVDADVLELQDAIQTSNSKTFNNLLHKHLGDRFNFPHHQSLFKIETYPEQNELIQKFSFTREFIDHLNVRLKTEKPQVYQDLTVRLKRVQLYLDYLRPIAEYEIRVSSFTQLFTMFSSIMYTPLQLWAQSNKYLFSLLAFAQAGHLITTTILEGKYDLSRSQRAQSILELVSKVPNLAQESSAKLNHCLLQQNKAKEKNNKIKDH